MLIGNNILYFSELESTNDYAKKLVRDGAAKNGDVVVANRQTKGKGRLCREWQSDADMGLYTSVILEFDPTFTAATLLFGLAACNAVEKASGVEASLKWSNDVIINNKKVCGILTEGCQSPCGVNYFVVGIGINVNNESFSSELAEKATSLFLETGENYPVTKIMKLLYHEMDYYYDEYKKGNGFKPFLSEYKSKCITLNKEVTVTNNGNALKCTAVDISETGELVVSLTNGDKRVISSGEVSVRGVLGYV